MDFLPVLRIDKSKEFYSNMAIFVKDVHLCAENLDNAIGNYCSGKIPQYRKSANLVIDLEEKADDSRRKLEKMLYTGVILPFGRGAKYELLESIDDIADKAELVARLILIEKLKIPRNLCNNFKKLSGLVLDSVTHLKTAVLQLDSDLGKAIISAAKVERIREDARTLEFRLMEQLFSKSGGSVDIILLKELIALIGNVADKAEESADRVVSLAVKYQG